MQEPNPIAKDGRAKVQVLEARPIYTKCLVHYSNVSAVQYESLHSPFSRCTVNAQLLNTKPESMRSFAQSNSP